MSPARDGDAVARALAYPYRRFARSVVCELAGGGYAAARLVRIRRAGLHLQPGYARAAETWDVELAVSGDAVRLGDCVAVVAAGSNAAPEQIARKWAGRGVAERIAVVPATLNDLASVYSGHVTRYGSVPATLHTVSGAQSRLHLLFVPAGELARLDETESIGRNYLVARLDGVDARTPAGVVRAPLAYVSRRGALTMDQKPVALAACRSRGGGCAALDQRAMLMAVHRRIKLCRDFDSFVRALIADADVRQEVTAHLAADAIRWRPAETSVLAGG